MNKIQQARLMIGLAFFSLNLSASELQVLSQDNRLDVGNAQILASKLEQVCTTRFNNPGQAFQCKSACGSLYKAVQGVSAQLNRQVAPRILKRSLKELAQRTLQCNQKWGRNFPDEFKPFAYLLKSLHEGNMPEPGTPAAPTPSNPEQYAQALTQLASQLPSLVNVCQDSLFKDSCQMSCDLQANSQQLSTLLQQGSLKSLDDMNRATPWVQNLRTQATELHRKTQQCAQHYGRTPASILTTMQTISKTVKDSADHVYARQGEVERLAREAAEQERQMQLAAQRAEKQRYYQEQVKKMRQCRSDSPFNSFSGCSYLTAIYDGDFKQAMDIEYQSSAPYRLGWMAEANQQMSQLLGAFFGNEEGISQAMADSWKAYHFIGRLLGTYATYYEHYYPQCVGKDPAIVTLTTARQREYRNGFGHLVRTEKLPSETDVISIPRRLYPFVRFNEINKDTQAQAQIWDMLGGAINQFPRINLFEVTMGLSNAMDRYSCDGPVIRQLEQQMLKYQSHRNQYNSQFSL